MTIKRIRPPGQVADCYKFGALSYAAASTWIAGHTQIADVKTELIKLAAIKPITLTASFAEPQHPAVFSLFGFGVWSSYSFFTNISFFRNA